MKVYHQEAKALPEPNKDLKALKSTYLEGIKGKEEIIEKLDQFIVLCQNSIRANENILEFTQQFEKHRSRVEAQISSAKQTSQGIEDSTKLEERLDENNHHIKRKQRPLFVKGWKSTNAGDSRGSDSVSSNTN